MVIPIIIIIIIIIIKYNKYINKLLFKNLLYHIEKMIIEYLHSFLQQIEAVSLHGN